jgi:hypothetical protein
MLDRMQTGRFKMSCLRCCQGSDRYRRRCQHQAGAVVRSVDRGLVSHIGRRVCAAKGSRFAFAFSGLLISPKSPKAAAIASSAASFPHSLWLAT